MSVSVPDQLKEAIGYLRPDTLVGSVLLLILFLLAGSVLSALLRLGMRKLLERDVDDRIDRLTALFLLRFAGVLLWAFVIMLYTHIIPALDRLGTALLTSVSIASVIIGLAAQSTLGNLIAGISLIFYRPFQLGDKLQVSAPTGLETGTVENVSLGYTTLKTYDNRRIVLSNANISNQIMINLTAVEKKVMTIIPFSIGYGAEIEQARAIALELVSAHDGVDEVVGCPLTALGPSSVDFTLRAWCADSGVAAQVKYDVLEALKKRFDAEGIEIPYAYQNVILKNSAGAGTVINQSEN